MRIEDLKVGNTIYADDAFTCLCMNEACVVHEDKGGLYVHCAGPDDPNELNAEADYGKPSTVFREEKHYLDEQEDEEGQIVGFSFEKWA